MRALALLPLIFVVGCVSSTTDYVQSQKGYRVVAGYVKKLDGLENPKVRKLQNGTAYTVTTEGCTVVLYFDQKDPRTRQHLHKTYELKPGDQFVNGRPHSYVLIRP